MNGLYRGFNSHEFMTSRTFQLTDIDLVKSDILNHIFTKKGERLMMANFGTIIPELVFEPLDDTTLSILTDELLRVFKYDPRVELLEYAITPDFDNNSVVTRTKLLYVELNVTSDFEFNIEFSS